MSKAERYFKHKTAIVRGISSSLPAEALRLETDPDPVDLETAKRQWNNYVEILRDHLGLRIIQIPTDDKLPDCVFVADVIIAIGNKALITQPGHPSRRPETLEMRKVVEQLGLHVTIMSDKDKNALLDMGDVLFTGEELFVGLGKRTNEAGFKVVQETFPEFPASSFPMEEGLHLTSGITLAEPGKIFFAVDHPGIKKMAEAITEKAKFKYTMIPLKGHETAANCIYVDSPKIGKTIIRPSFDKFPLARSAYDQVTVPNIICCDTSELCKVDGALTCNSVLLNI